MIKKTTCPKCQNEKDYRATQCTACRRKEWEERRLVGRRIACACGQLMDHRALECLSCFHKKENARRQLRFICACGGPKGEKSSVCLKCARAANDPIKDGTRICTACCNPFGLDYFHTFNGGTKHRSVCKTCTKPLERKRHIVSKCLKLNMAMPDILRIVQLNGTHCQSCGDFVEKFHIDHCHITNRFRGLLCSNCNSGLGLFNDHIGRLQMAIAYLEQFATKQGVK